MELELFRDRAAVESLAAGTRDLFQPVGMALPAEPLAGTRRAAVRHERLGETRLALELANLLFPLARNGGRDEKAFASVLDRPLEQALERQLAKLRVQLHPGGNAPRHGHRVPAAHRH